MAEHSPSFFCSDYEVVPVEHNQYTLRKLSSPVVVDMKKTPMLWITTVNEKHRTLVLAHRLDDRLFCRKKHTFHNDTDARAACDFTAMVADFFNQLGTGQSQSFSVNSDGRKRKRKIQ